MFAVEGPRVRTAGRRLELCIRFGVLRWELEAVYVDDSLGEGLRGFLREVVSDAAGDEPVVILAGELVAIGCAGRVDCPV